MTKRACIVTGEIKGYFSLDSHRESSQVFTSLSQELINKGYKVTILLVHDAPFEGVNHWFRHYANKGIEVLPLYTANPLYTGGNNIARSFQVYQWLKNKNYSELFFAEKCGLAHCSLQAKAVGLAFADIPVTVIAKNPTMYEREICGELPAGLDDIENDFLERYSVEHATQVYFCTSVLKDWAVKYHWKAAPVVDWASLGAPRESNRKSEELAIQTDPLVSVCIPHFERTGLLIQALESLAHQTYTQFEVIVVDDGTTSEAQLSQLLTIEKEILPKINGKLIRTVRQGPSQARNLAASEAQGKYLLFMDDDNYAKPQQIEFFVRAAEKSSADIVTCAFETFFSREAPNSASSPVKIWAPYGNAPALGFFRNIFGDMNCLVNKASFYKAGAFQGDKNIVGEDWEFFIRASLSGQKIETIPEVLFCYRDHNSTQSKKPTYYSSFLKRLEPYYKEVPEYLKQLLLLLLRLEGAIDPSLLLRQTKEESMLMLLCDIDLSSSNIKPIHDTKSLCFTENKLHLVSKGSDPGMLLPPLTLEQTDNILIEVEITAPRTTYLQIFFQTKEIPAFSEMNSLKQNLAEGWNLVHFRVKVPELNGLFRIDAGDVVGDFFIHSIKVYASYDFNKIVEMKKRHRQISHQPEFFEDLSLKKRSDSKSLFNKYLLKAALLFEKKPFSRLNRIFRYFYSYIFTKGVQFYINRRGARGILLEARHSSKHGLKFNPLFSDLDWDVVLPNEQLLCARKVKVAFDKVKKYFPFIGEQEFYSESELTAKKQLMLSSEPLYSALRDIRKVYWMEQAYKEATSSYHRYKSLRAIQNCFNKLGIDAPARSFGNQENLNAWLNEKLSKEFPALDTSNIAFERLDNTKVLHPYLGLPINFSQKAIFKSEFYLPVPKAVLLLSLLPIYIFKDDYLNQAIAIIHRQNPQIREFSENLRLIELATTIGAARAYEVMPEWAENAIKYLGKENQT